MAACNWNAKDYERHPMPEHIDIYNLLKKGHFFRIRQGTVKSVVTDILGCSDKMHCHEPGTGLFLLLHGPIEIYFFNDEVLNLVIKTRSLESDQRLLLGNESLFFTNTATLDEVTELLSECRLGWEISNAHKENYLILTEGGATIEFDGSNSRQINRIHLVA